MDKPWSLYVLEARSGALYTGVTRDINRRFRQHAGELKGGAKFFRKNPPELLVYEEFYENRSQAQQREAEIKRLSRAQKETLVYSFGET